MVAGKDPAGGHSQKWKVRPGRKKSIKFGALANSYARYSNFESYCMVYVRVCEKGGYTCISVAHLDQSHASFPPFSPCPKRIPLRRVFLVVHKRVPSSSSSFASCRELNFGPFISWFMAREMDSDSRVSRPTNGTRKKHCLPDHDFWNNRLIWQEHLIYCEGKETEAVLFSS